MPESAQRELFAAGAPVPRVAIPLADKVATRARQGGLCARCGGTSKLGALDVVRERGVLVALCRRDRLRFDAVDRCRKGAQKRRRRAAKPMRSPSGQLAMRSR